MRPEEPLGGARRGEELLWPLYVLRSYRSAALVGVKVSTVGCEMSFNYSNAAGRLREKLEGKEVCGGPMDSVCFDVFPDIIGACLLMFLILGAGPCPCFFWPYKVVKCLVCKPFSCCCKCAKGHDHGDESSESSLDDDEEWVPPTRRNKHGHHHKRSKATSESSVASDDDATETDEKKEKHHSHHHKHEKKDKHGHHHRKSKAP